MPNGQADLEAEITAALQGAAVDVGSELIDQATNFFGPLSPDVRGRLLSLLRNPSPETWDDTYSIVLNDVGLGRTLWQAMLRVDPGCPRSGRPEAIGEHLSPEARWNGYRPDPLTVLNAIQSALSS